MSTNHLKSSFEGFRGRPGTAYRKYLITYIKTFLGVDTKSLIMEWEELFNRIARSEGEIQAVRKTKSLYDYALRYSCGLTVSPLPFTRSRKDGLPRSLSNYRKLLKGSPDARRAALTVLQLYKLHIVRPPYSLESIVKPYSGKKDLEWIQKFKDRAERLFPTPELNRRISELKPGFHISGSNGPNGPCVGTAFVDREVIRGTVIETSARNLAVSTKFNYLVKLFLDTAKPVDISHKRGRLPSHSRIRIKYEPGAKARPFCICDFFSQSSLKSLHDYIMRWLKNNPMDSSSEHARAAETVREWTKDPNRRLWSYDLTTATDRFPVLLLEICVEKMFGSKIKDLWKSIMIDRTFEGPNGEEVRFAVGQPLGALSSWGSFSVAHHVLIQTAAAEVGYPNFRDYRMIGDDICISGPAEIALKYKSYLDDLGVDISIGKSVLPEQCSDGNAAEIAKRLFHKGVEVTPVPPLAIKEAMGTLTGFRSLVESSWNRGYNSTWSPYPVQSCLTTKLDFASFTFPVRNRLPLLKGVKSLFQDGNPFEDDAPAGLNPYWFIWNDIPDEIITKAVRRFLFDRVNKAVGDSLVIQQRILLARYSLSERAELPQGGNWLPGTFTCHPEIVTEVFSDLQEVLLVNQQRLWDDNILLGDVVDLYSFIGQLHKYLEPEILLIGRSDFSDEKSKTRVFVSSLIKYVSSMAKAKDFTQLDVEPEVDNFSFLEQLEYSLLE